MKLYEKNILEPKYIIAITNDNNKTIYQKKSSERNLFGNNINLFVQDTINNTNNETPNKILIVDDTNKEFAIDDCYFIEKIIGNIKKSRNIKYIIFKFNNKIIKINEEYEWEDKKYSNSYINEKLLLLLTGTVAIANFILYKIASK